MKPSGTSRPKQFRAPIALKKGRRERPGQKAWPKEPEEPIRARLPASPRPKALCPYTPSTSIEDTHLRSLIHYYVTFVTATTLINVGPRFEWYGLAVRDEAFFHALLSSISSHYSYTTGIELPYKWIFFRHRVEAIRMVNRRIAQGACDEGTINAIVVFAQQESFEARPEEAKKHIEGLNQLVRAAGGIRSPEFSEKTRRHLFFVDLAASISLNSKPLLPPILDLTNLAPYFGKASPETLSHLNSFGTRLYNFTGSPLCDQAVSVWWGLRCISELVDAFKEGRDIPETASPSDIQFSDRVEVLERLVHRLWFIENPATPQHVLFLTFGWTCLIHIYTKFRELPLELGMNSMLARKVKAALETCGELNVLLATFPDLFLWEMFICGRAASDRDKPFLAQQASKILMVRKLEDANDILAASDKFLWPERGTEAPFVTAGPAHVSREVIEIVDT